VSAASCPFSRFSRFSRFFCQALLRLKDNLVDVASERTGPAQSLHRDSFVVVLPTHRAIRNEALIPIGLSDVECPINAEFHVFGESAVLIPLV
jgi:hypothetical protein